MGLNVYKEQRDIILNTIKNITQGDWKVLVLDQGAKKLIDNVLEEDDILNENIANIEMIEDRREMNPEMDAIYLLTPLPHIVDCVMADIERRRYRGTYLVWTALLDPQLRRRIHDSAQVKAQLRKFETLSVNWFPRESHLVTFRDPWSFPILYHPACALIVGQHIQELAQKISALCVSLGEYPKVRYYRPREESHPASVLSEHLARTVQEELDSFAQFNESYPPPSTRPQGILLITDRAMDLVAPLIHEFTYQAMAHDLLPIKEGDKVVYKTVVHEGQADQDEKEMEIGEKDKIWVDNRHRHMKDTIEKLMGDFQKFIERNPHFTNTEGDATSLNAIKDMLAGLPQFQEMKEAYSLHLTMAHECMNIFQQHKLPDIASVEQSLATGLDEDFRKPKNLADQLVRLLDDENITSGDRLRLMILYIMYRDGVINEDVDMLLAHSSLPANNTTIIRNFKMLGVRPIKPLKDSRPAPQPLFPKKLAPTKEDEEYALSRFEPMVKLMLENVVKGSLDQRSFPYTKPPLDNSNEMAAQAQTSLRSAKPTWARNRTSTADSRQRIIVFMAGGATYSESRACYEVSATSGRDIFLATSHMTTPSLFLRQVGDLSEERRRLNLPVDQPPPRAPSYLFKANDPKPVAPLAPTQGLGLPGNSVRGGPLPKSPAAPPPISKYQDPRLGGMAALNLNDSSSANGSDGKGKLEKKSKHSKKDSGEGKEKKKRHFFSSKKDK